MTSEHELAQRPSGAAAVERPLDAPAEAGASPSDAAEARIPLVLDLDHTLLRTDTLHEQALAFLKTRVLNIFRLIVWTLQGRAALKRRLAQAVELDVDALPVNEEVAAYARAEAAKGRKIVLATAADKAIADKVLARFDFLSEALGSDGGVNLKGRRKAAALAERFPDGFDYAGDSPADLAVWKRARRAVLVGVSADTARRARRQGPVAESFPRKAPARALLKAMRPHHWVKNGLIVAPAILSGKIFDPSVYPSLLLAFLGLGLVASATYIINDIWDVADDRRHWSKKERPIASGALSIAAGAAAAPLGVLAGLGVAALAGPQVVAALCAYLALTLLYSFHLKRVVIQDALTLAALFTIRLMIGAVAVGAVLSPWLFVFSMFFFSSLAFAKRHTEIARVIAQGGDKVGGRGYELADLPLVLAAGLSTAVAAVVILVLYIIEDAFTRSFFGQDLWLWGFPPLIFLLMTRIWVVCQRGQLNDDPIVFALTDRQSQVLVGLLGLCFLLAWRGVPL